MLSYQIEAFGKPLAQALRAGGKVDPVFVPDINDMAKAVLQHARHGDAVLCMGAGSIGSVPAGVLAQATREVAA